MSLSLGIYVAGASARYQHLLHSVGSGRTSPPVRRRDPFPACRSTRGVVDGSRTFGNRVPHGSWSSSVGPATVLPLSAGDGGTMRDPIHVASRFFPVSFSCETLQSPHRLGRARGIVRELGTGAAASTHFAGSLVSGSRQSLGNVGVVARRRFTLPPATSGQRRASATHPTRLETRTEESWPFASRRGPFKNPGGVAKARERVGGHRFGEVSRRSRPPGLPSRARSCRRDESRYFPSSAPRTLSSP